jgi:hypothetical protein
MPPLPRSLLSWVSSWLTWKTSLTVFPLVCSLWSQVQLQRSKMQLTFVVPCPHSDVTRSICATRNTYLIISTESARDGNVQVAHMPADSVQLSFINEKDLVPVFRCLNSLFKRIQQSTCTSVSIDAADLRWPGRFPFSEIVTWLRKCTQLRELQLRSVCGLQEINVLSGLKKLRLAGHSLQINHLSWLGTLPLQELSLSDCYVRDLILPPRLKVLNLERARFCVPAGGSVVLYKLNHSRVEDVFIEGVWLEIGSLPRCRRLHVDLLWPQPNLPAWLAGQKHVLEHLRLSCWCLDFRPLSQFLQLPQLQSLELFGFHLTSSPFPDADLSELRSLTIRDPDYCLTRQDQTRLPALRIYKCSHRTWLLADCMVNDCMVNICSCLEQY